MSTLITVAQFANKHKEGVYGATGKDKTKSYYWGSGGMIALVIRIFLFIAAIIVCYQCTKRTPTSTGGKVLSWIVAILFPEIFLIYAGVRKLANPKFCSGNTAGGNIVGARSAYGMSRVPTSPGTGNSNPLYIRPDGRAQ